MFSTNKLFKMYFIYLAFKKGWNIEKIKNNTFIFSKTDIDNKLDCENFIKNILL